MNMTLPVFRDSMRLHSHSHPYRTYVLHGRFVVIHDVRDHMTEKPFSSTNDRYGPIGRIRRNVTWLGGTTNEANIAGMPKFKTAKECIRWLWFAHARDYLAEHKCEDCGATDDVNLHLQSIDGSGVWQVMLCDDCATDNYSSHDIHARLPRCRIGVALDDETISYDGGFISSALFHNDDMRQCDNCGDDGPRALMHDTSEGNDVCSTCLDEDYAYCVDIEGYTRRDDAYWCEANGDWYCYESNVPAYNILAYNCDVLAVLDNRCYVKRNRHYLSDARNQLLFGVELETDVRSGHAPDELAEVVLAENFGDYGICKDDSTVSGIEMVTVPCDLDSHLNLLQWQQWCDVLRPIAKGHYGRDNGMHIHMSRSALPPLILGKLLVFMNNRKHARFLSGIAQRDIDNTQWAPQKDDPKFKKVGRAGNDPYAGKYAILNTTQSTVECRMFNSTLIAERIFKNIEFLHALVSWAKRQPASPLNAGTDCTESYVNHVHDNRKEYPHLSKFIDNRIEA